MPIQPDRRRSVRSATAALVSAAVALAVMIAPPMAATAAPPPETPEERAQALLAQMTLEEKVDMLEGELNPYYGFFNAANERLGIPELRMADGPAGVRIANPDINGKRATSLPAPIALASTWDLSAAAEFGDVIGNETFNTGHNVSLGTAVDIARVGEAGRTFEIYGEDPLLSGKVAGSQITGIQGYPILGDIKHYNTYNQEDDRLIGGNSVVGERALQEIYTRPFAIGLREGDPATTMCAFNKVNWVYSCASSELLEGILRDQLGFTGYVMSDYSATHAAQDILSGLDQEQPSFGNFEWLVTGVQTGQIPESAVDTAALRVLTTMIKYGLFDTPAVNVGFDEEGHAAVSQDIAERSAVLLKNEGLLPLTASELDRVAVIGADATSLTAGGGSSLVLPTGGISPLQGLTDALPDADVVHAPGSDHVTASTLLQGVDAIPSDYLTAANGEPGADLTLSNANGEVTLQTVVQDVTYNGGFYYFEGFNSQSPDIPALPPGGMAKIEYGATLTPEESGTYALELGVSGGDATVLLDGTEVVTDDSVPYSLTTQNIDLVGGQAYALSVVYNVGVSGGLIDAGPQVKLGWTKPEGVIDPQAQAAAELAETADVAIVIVRDYGTEGGDKIDLGLPVGQEELIRQVKAANPNTIVVLNTGGPITTPEWEDGVPAIVETWYAGQNQGAALARLLLGEVNPSGKLPVTFPTTEDATPVSSPEQYPGIGLDSYYTEGVFVGYRGYQHFGLDPAYEFGHGLSYTSFDYSDLATQSKGKGQITATFTVTNTGERAGVETPQVYVGQLPTDVVETAPKQLAGFTKVALEPGESTQVTIDLARESFSYWDSYTDGWITPKGELDVYVGASSEDIRLDETVSVKSSDKENASGISSKAVYAAVNEGSGACLDAVDNGVTDGTVVQQWACPAPMPNAQWTLAAVKGGDSYRITNVNAGLVLQVADASTAEGAGLELWTSSKKDDSQEFELVRVGDGYYQFVNVNSGLCVAVDGGSRDNGAAIVQESCDADSTAQAFALKVQGG
jgi:beta-glucosidase